MESLKLKFTENKQTLVCSYTSTVTPINGAPAGTAERNTDDRSTVRISLLFKDQVAPNAVGKQ